MSNGGRFWRNAGIPVLVSLGLLGGLNAIYSHPVLSAYLGPYFLYTAVVPMVGGSLPALLFLWRGARAGVICRRDLGVEPADWTAPRRLGAMAVIVLVAYVTFTLLQTAAPDAGPAAAAVPAPAPDVPPFVLRPTWGDFCFWFAFLLSSSLAELLVFIAVGFCLLERGLRQQGLPPPLATTLAAFVSCVTFGVYHYTHEPRWWPSVYPLMGEMLIMLMFFRLTRNFYWTIIVHNITAAGGFATAQFSKDPIDPTPFRQPVALATNLLAFAIPFVLLGALEWKGWPPAKADDRPAG